MITDKAKVLCVYPDAVAESFYHPNGRLIWGIWTAPRDMCTTDKKCRYLLGGALNETQAWKQAAVGVENLCALIKSI